MTCVVLHNGADPQALALQWPGMPVLAPGEAAPKGTTHLLHICGQVTPAPDMLEVLQEAMQQHEHAVAALVVEEGTERVACGPHWPDPLGTPHDPLHGIPAAHPLVATLCGTPGLLPKGRPCAMLLPADADPHTPRPVRVILRAVAHVPCGDVPFFPPLPQVPFTASPTGTVPALHDVLAPHGLKVRITPWGTSYVALPAHRLPELTAQLPHPPGMDAETGQQSSEDNVLEEKIDLGELLRLTHNEPYFPPAYEILADLLDAHGEAAAALDVRRTHCARFPLPHILHTTMHATGRAGGRTADTHLIDICADHLEAIAEHMRNPQAARDLLEAARTTSPTPHLFDHPLHALAVQTTAGTP